MRAYKFRAWDTIDKRMRYAEDVDGIPEWPSLLAIGFHGLPICISPDSFKENEIIGWNRDHNLILMQFTGLQDRNGKDIYEGDIVGCESIGVERYQKRVVCYDIHQAKYKTVPRSTYYANAGHGGWTGYDLRSECEVLGNIYENPELLEATP